MALGGGSFTQQSKVLPGSYINFVSAARAAAVMSERGYTAIPLEMDWGKSKEVFTLSAEDFYKLSQTLFGYRFDHEKLKGIRDLFKNAKVLYGYRVNGDGNPAACNFAAARYSGIRGNALRLVISKDKDKYTVNTLLDNLMVDSQIVGEMAELADNDYVVFKRETVLSETAGIPFTGGTNSTPDISDYQQFLDQAESYSYNILGLVSDDEGLKDLFAEYTKRMREEMGIKFQTVLYRYAGDYEGIISLENSVKDTEETAWDLVYWVAGAASGCEINSSNTNKTYNGEYQVDTSYTQKELENAIQEGKFIMHKVGDEVRVLEDINSLVSYTEEKGNDFSSNQTVRILDQIGNDIAALFNNRYLGKIPNDESGRISLWNDVVTYYRELEKRRAIENFKADDIVITQGETKRSVVASCPVTPVNAMAQLYMTVVVQ